MAYIRKHHILKVNIGSLSRINTSNSYRCRRYHICQANCHLFKRFPVFYLENFTK